MSRTRQPMASNLFQTTTESPQDSSTAHIPTTLRLRAEEAPTDASEATSSSRRIRWSEDVYAASTTKLGQWEKVAQKNLHPAHLRVTARVKTTVAPPESTGLATHTHTTERREPHGEHASHPDEGCCPEDHGSKPKRNRRKPSPNAYEKMPKPSKNPKQNQNHARGT
ncbi:hypothetical protein N7519_000127 [Penicillium mononematosum]|uniref:uncharacterized protein n=1 Tax=Penicillium mononematosum TaxID=268346 RepID=UPI002547E20B|nr:uncharacterized protein N7519_000127 [Penicillium mononematosum]KAJ6190106.1 hypothetical protein N7519_000127 [Penicillium mononematosum]